MGKQEDKDTTFLPRGGVLLESSIGEIQYGAVPETIKDTVLSPAGVPSIYVVPGRPFDPGRGINLAELEFPAYWNFFLKNRRITVVCQREQRRVITKVLEEAAFGPDSLDSSEFGGPRSRTAMDLTGEMSYFRRNPMTGQPLSLGDLVEFREFDERGKVELAKGVDVVLDESGGLAVVEGGKVRSRSYGEPRIPPIAERRMGSAETFRPPLLGVTVIGAGHGFDPGNRTSGFVIWIDGRGIMVDPPVDALDWLADVDMEPRMIDGLILTHCHADHDAGTLQKLLQEGRVTIYTTATVLSSFVTKYSLLTGMKPENFRKLFDHVEVRSGEPTSIHGAEVTFRYSLHSIPCAGFEILHRGKGLVYPSDTLNDPKVIWKLREDGILSDDRAKELASFPWHHQLILHEAGIPPIHTPVAYLDTLPEDVKRRLYLVHVSSKSIPEGSMLRVAPTGLDKTVDMQVDRPVQADALEILDAMSRVDILAGLPAARAADFLRCVRKDHYKKGELVVAQGTPGDRFYVVLDGHASVCLNHRELKVYNEFDYFGESALVTGELRSADVYAKTDLTVLSVDRSAFLNLLRGTDLPSRLEHLARLRAMHSWEILGQASAFADLTSNQKTQLQQVMIPVEYKAGHRLAKDPVLVATGRVSVARDHRSLSDIKDGGLVIDLRALLSGKPSRYRFKCATAVKGYRFRGAEFRSFLKKNPGVYLRLATLETSQ